MRKIGSTRHVPLSVIDELASLLHIALVVLVLLLLFFRTDFFVLSLAESSRDIGVVSELAYLDILVRASSVLVAVAIEQVEVENAVGQSVLGSGHAAVSRCRGKGRSRSQECASDDGGSLHDARVTYYEMQS